MLRSRELRAPRWMCAVWMPTKITLLSPGSSQPLMVETLFWVILWTGPSVQQKHSKSCGYDGTNSEDELVFSPLCRCEVGTNRWIQCNDTPVKFARFPVTGLVEGRSYIFRVRAVNHSGMSQPSRVSEPVAAMDPADRARMRGTASFIVWSTENVFPPVCPLKHLKSRILEKFQSKFLWFIFLWFTLNQL